MKKDQKIKRLIITGVDSNPVNQNALKILLKSINANLNGYTKDITVIYPQNELSLEYLTWLETNKISTFSGKPFNPNDPYRVKLLLIDIIKEKGKNYDEIFYLDPDHIFLNQFKTINSKNALKVSSEIKPLGGEIVKCFRTKQNSNIKEFIHYNTSIIYGNYKSWKKALDKWEHVYNKIFDFTSNRFREEIAFTYAAIQQKVQIIPVIPKFQSNFLVFDRNCIIFHYGGEFPQTKRIKLCLQHEDMIIDSFLNQLDSSQDFLESWVIQEIINILQTQSI